MPDRFYQQNAAGDQVTDLSPVVFVPWFLERDSFAYAPGETTRVTVAQPAELGGGELVIRERRTNDRISARWVVLGEDQQECWDNAQVLVECFRRPAGSTDAGLDDLRLYWQPEGVPDEGAWLMSQQGSADWTFAYAWAPLTMGAAAGQAVLMLGASWAVRPYVWQPRP